MEPSEIRDVRGALGLTQTGLGRALGVSLRAVQAWESGERAVPEPVARILRVADLPLIEKLLLAASR